MIDDFQQLMDMLGGTFNDKFKLHGALDLVLEKRDEAGNLIAIETRHKDNIVVNNGFDFIADAIGNAARGAVMQAIAIGTNTTAAAAGDATLGTELVRQAATYAHTAGTKVFTFTTNFAAGTGTGAITEAGVLNSATTGGTLLDHVVFSVVNKGVSDTLTVTFTFTMS